MKSSVERQLRDANRQLARERDAHQKTRTELQAEIQRWQWLASPRIFELMAVYPSLKKLLSVLAEAAELQDPAKGAPTSDTMRTEVTQLTSVEQAVLSHKRHRQNVRIISGELEHLRKKFNEQLEYKSHWMAQLIGGSEWEYQIPEKTR